MPICHRPSCRLSQTELQSPHEAHDAQGRPTPPPPMADKFSISLPTRPSRFHHSLFSKEAVWVRTKIERMMALPFDVLESIVQRLIPHPEPMTVNAVIAAYGLVPSHQEPEDHDAMAAPPPSKSMKVSQPGRLWRLR